MSRWPSSVTCHFHQTVATPLCDCIHVSPSLVSFTGSTRRSSSRREGALICLVGKYACWMGGSCIRCQAHTHASISTTLISLSCLLTSELRWRRLGKAHRPNVPAQALRLYNMFTVVMTQQAVLLDQTSECSCASATSCCVCEHADDEASLTTCATCMMNYHKECVETFAQYVVGLGKVSIIHCQCSPLLSAIFKGALGKVSGSERVRHCWRVTAVDPVFHECSFASQLVECHRKKNENGRESHMFQHLLFHFHSNFTFEIVRQRRREPSGRTRLRTNANNFDESGKNYQNSEKK